MKKPTIKRLVLGLLQQLAAMLICIAIAGVLFNSYMSIKAMTDTKVYQINPFQEAASFEESELFADIVRTSVADVMRLVVIKEQLETDGELDGTKKIDVTRYAGRKDGGNHCPITAVYELEDLIRWGSVGVSYSTETMTMSDFVNFFQEYYDYHYFMLDDNMHLHFAGFRPAQVVATDEVEPSSNDEKRRMTEWELAELLQIYSEYTEGQLENLVFSYIMDQVSDHISLSLEADGTVDVSFSLLNCRYPTVDGELSLLSYADNWVDYIKLQCNLVETIDSLKTNYQQYQEANVFFQENNNNLKYLVQMQTEEGVRIFTNVEALEGKREGEITEFFAEFQRYLIYYPDDMNFMGDTVLTEQEMSEYMNVYDYAYPPNTRIWVGVDTEYSAVGDNFYNGNAMYHKIVPYANRIVLVTLFLLLVWIAIGIYLTVTAGIGKGEEGEAVLYLNPIDRIWMEFLIFFGIVWLGTVILGYRYLDGLRYVQADEIKRAVSSFGQISRYMAFGVYGFVSSMLFNVIWYSLVRRVRSGYLWKRSSFLGWIFSALRRGVNYMISHGNVAINTFLPYNLFLLINLMSVVSLFALRNRAVIAAIIIVLLVVFDGLVGMMLFRSNAERRNIMEGIRKIRDGEVEYKLEAEELHGSGREMANAINHIGEGIRKAVKTSIKDEQMKTDLITNVSHDIKTPLTSIINYVDLLKRLEIDSEPAKSYIDVLDGKSQRLKQLADDLVEASKLSSGNIEFQRERLNLTELLYQAMGEFVEKMEEKKLRLVFNEEEPAYIYADSRRMWRVVENLLNNVYKYALENTRVYLEINRRKNGTEYIEFSIKNISERQMNIRADDLTERFIRGDPSRATEGSGLGLYIAKNLVEAQGGEFEIRLDGDLFKAVICFPAYQIQEI